MSTDTELPTIRVEEIDRVLRVERGALVVAERDCPRCAAYLRELVQRRLAGELPGVDIAVLHVDPSDLMVLPYTLLFRYGRRVHSFAGVSAAPLVERFGRRARAASLPVLV